MIRAALLSFALLTAIHAQPSQIVYPQPPCAITLNLTGSGSAPANQTAGGPSDNRFQGCQIWYLTFSISGFSSITVTLQSAPDANGTPGTWVTFANQLVSSGSNPATISSGGGLTVLNNSFAPWVRILVATTGGPGVVTGAAYGWQQ